jgi:CRISPR-associated endonuclease/helicase Cas3
MPWGITDLLDAEHLIRMCLSALADADRLDTERFYDPCAGRGEYPRLAWYLDRLRERISRFPAPTTELGLLRQEVQEACARAGEGAPGFYRLSVPTGGGKTLASLRFALEHAVRHGLERVIFAIPYTSIINQTAGVLAEAFGAENILEHHSGADPHSAGPGENEDQNLASVRCRLAAENWDCPLILTTNVQLFESLLHNHPTKTRKLHNMARSVVVLDEVQTLPPDLLQPCLSVLDWMTRYANASVLFCTATQPDYSRVPMLPDAPRCPAEIVENPASLQDRLKRVNFSYAGLISCEGVAKRLAPERQALAILNSRRDSVQVFDILRSLPEADEDGDFYLSTLLVPHHRRKLLENIRARLANRLPCRVVSTQVVEAGVDLDFPLVLRAMAPLDSLIQAAGRCNREGELPGLGRCEVFELEGGSVPSGYYQSAISVTRRFVPARIGEIDTSAAQAEYFRALLNETTIATDREIKTDGAKTTVQRARRALDYPVVAANTKLIEDDTVGVVVQDYAPEEVDAQLDRWRRGASPRLVARRLSQFMVSLYERDAMKAQGAGLVRLDESGFLIWVGPYDAKTGVAHGVVADPNDLIK